MLDLGYLLGYCYYYRCNYCTDNGLGSYKGLGNWKD